MSYKIRFTLNDFELSKHSSIRRRIFSEHDRHFPLGSHVGRHGHRHGCHDP